MPTKAIQGSTVANIDPSDTYNKRLPLSDAAKSDDPKIANKLPGCSRFDLLLSATQLIKEEYPLPGYEEYRNYSFTQEKYEPVTDRSPMFAIDCEWCTCIDGDILKTIGFALRFIYKNLDQARMVWHALLLWMKN